MKKYPPTVNRHEYLIKDLRSPEVATGYLNACLEEGDKEIFSNALRNVLEAQGGMTKIPKAAKLNHVGLYNIIKLLQAVGIRFSVTHKKKKLRPKAA